MYRFSYSFIYSARWWSKGEKRLLTPPGGGAKKSPVFAAFFAYSAKLFFLRGWSCYLMGRSQQRKGADGEKELAEKLKEFGFAVQRGGSMTYGEVPDLLGLPGIHIEVKRVEKLNIYQAIQQAIDDSARFHDGMPTVFHRRNRKPWLVTMLLSDWIKVYTDLLEKRTEENETIK